ncbi:protein FAR1-RELATED SEQUENCE 7-like [Lotus japonicus]|uniref:protein FAR1-RELATED SEQUENCE 7-like n=1 Tax=Lotus japonicus TaxID=34305 RepID=UPI00258BC397|nr:protein FAR1-RELATED SEQUENCE 7-like [Lotus japonicus]
MANSTEISYGGTECLNGNSDQSGSLKDVDKMSEDLDELNVEDKNGEDCSVDFEYEEETHIDGTDATIDINNEDDILMIDLKNLCPDKVSMLSFISLDIAYLFYTWYGRVNGFSVRRSSILRSKTSHEVLQQTFVCSREGKRRLSCLTMEDRKRRAKNETRLGCEPKFRVHIHIVTRRWYVTIFAFAHNHELLDGLSCGMLPPYRKMNESDVVQMNNMRMAGIGAHDIFSSFAMQSGGYENVGFRQKAIYNQVGEQRAEHESDGVAALKVNHHQQTIVFASAIVGNEKEETYVWLLQRLMEVIKDKTPTSVITDGDIPMKNAIKVVLPQSHHRLCAWHLCWNATSNLHNPEFTAAFNHYMFAGYYDIGTWKKKWTEMVDKFELHENG